MKVLESKKSGREVRSEAEKKDLLNGDIFCEILNLFSC